MKLLIFLRLLSACFFIGLGGVILLLVAVLEKSLNDCKDTEIYD